MLRATLTIISGFLAVILIGTIVLCLPISVNGESLSPVDALFTSTSAVCVTGLIVEDTATKFTIFGQIVILILIQLGGVGVITFSVLVMLFLGKRISLLQRDVIASRQGVAELKFDIGQIARPIVTYVLISEGIGAVLLFIGFCCHMPVHRAAYHALFHSVSAFCNAGFSTFSNSVVDFGGNWLIMLTMMALIVLGGLGFIVVLDLNETLRRHVRITLHTRIVLITSAVLIIVGAAAFFFIEHDNVLRDKPFDEKILASLFHSVTTRTAGFNSVDYAEVTNGTVMLTTFLMFIGGSPGSTAGGIKTTTIAIIILLAVATIKGRRDPEFGNKAISERSVTDAFTLTAVAVVFVLFVILLLQISETDNLPQGVSERSFATIAFEGISAFGTVGLSMGVTPQLSVFGRIVVIITMFIGRLGPLTFFYMIASKPHKYHYRLYAKSVMVG